MCLDGDEECAARPLVHVLRVDESCGGSTNNMLSVSSVEVTVVLFDSFFWIFSQVIGLGRDTESDVTIR